MLQVARLENVFEQMGVRPKAVPCEAIAGLIAEAEEVIAESAVGAVRDAGLIAFAQAVEHYEMARYSSLVEWAQSSGKKDIVLLLKKTLDEENKANKTLDDLALNQIIKSAQKLHIAA